MTPFWSIKIRLDRRNLPLDRLQYRDEIWLSPHVRASGLENMAHVASRSLAQAFLDGCRATLDRRYGSDYQAEVVDCSGSTTRSLEARIARDTQIVEWRLASGNFAPNKTLDLREFANNDPGNIR